MRSCVIDIESNSLIADAIDYTSLPYKLNSDAKIWVVCVTDVDTGESFNQTCDGITKEWLASVLAPYDYLILHNGMKFDLPVLMLFNLIDYSIGYMEGKDKLNGKDVRFIDTLILSRITNPDRLGGHGLAAWGKRTGNFKTDYREQCIEQGYIEKGAPKGTEFLAFNDLMLPYCIQDCSATISTYNELLSKDLTDYDGWKDAIRQEHKLADLAIRRETFGFAFDKQAAVDCVNELTIIMQELTDKVNPILPKRELNQTEIKMYSPPKVQFIANGNLSVAMLNFVERIGAEIQNGDLYFEGDYYSLPLEGIIKTEKTATIDDLDTVKGYLIELGWIPTEWRERDFTKDSKKQTISFDKRIKAFDKWFKETTDGKYKELRLQESFETHKVRTVELLYDKIIEKLHKDFPVRLPTSPQVRVGVEKELCPNLIILGSQVDFAKDFVNYLTYKHRKSSIAGGNIEEMDFDEESPNTGYLSMYREQDGRIPTPAIEIGASTHRYKHIGVANIPRATSIYGKEMRSLFGCGKGYVQFGFDFASLEARVEGSYCYGGTDGIEYAKSLTAEKPNDVHTINAAKLNIDRTSAKSFKYALTYGAQVNKVMKMLSISKQASEELFAGFWDGAPSLKELKQTVEQEWIANDKQYIRGIDGRKIRIRSQHSILNALFQSTGVIAAKYSLIFAMEKLERDGYCVDCFKGVPDVAEMISYHDEAQIAVKQSLIDYVKFDNKEAAHKFIKDWNGEEQLSTVSEGKVWYIALPNVVSRAVDYGITKANQVLKLNVPLGFEWVVAKNWYGCH